MAEFAGHVASVVEVTLGSETTVDHLTGDTVLSIAEVADFYEGVDVLIGDDTYAVTDVDSGDETGEPTITVDPPLVADVDTGTRVDVWDADTSSVVSEWIATITDDTDGSSMTAPLTHTLIALMSADIRGIVGESVVARQDDADEWWVVEVIGKTPEIDPGYFRTGTIQADVQITVGDPDGKRVVIDGSPAIEAYDASNHQTVNIDGEANYVEGTFATAADGLRIELGPGDDLLPNNEVRIYSGDPDEVNPAIISASVSESAGSGSPVFGSTTIAGHQIAGAVDSVPFLRLNTATSDGIRSTAEINAHETTIGGDLTAAGDTTLGGATIASASVLGTLNVGHMGSGDLGSGTFRDAIDTRINDIASVYPADETTAGIAEVATQTETNFGLDDTRIVTPLKLQTRLAAYAQPLDADLTAIAALTTTTYGRALLTLANQAALVALLPSYQPLDSDLTAIAALASAANKMPYATGSGTWSLADLTAFARTLLDDADASTALTTLGVSTFIKTLLDDADASTALSTLGVSTFIKTLLDDADASTARSTLGAQASDATLTALAGLTTSADQMIYSTGSDAFAMTALSSFIRTLLDDADAATARTTLGAQPLDATLTALAGVTTAANKLIYATGVDTFSTVDFTALAQSLSAISTAAAFRTAILSKDKRPGVNTQTANYTVAAADEDVRVQINSATAKTVTLPSDTTDPSLPTNFEASVTRLGAGTVTFVADTGVTIDSRGALLGINGQYGLVNIKKRASNRWIIWGDLV